MTQASAPPQGGVSGALTRRLGPLAVWQWGLVVAGGYLLYHYLKTGSLFGGGGGGGTIAPNLAAGDTGLVPGSALPPATPAPTPVPPASGGGGQGQADPGTIKGGGTSPSGTTLPFHAPTSSGNYGTGTSTSHPTSTPSIPKTVQPGAAISSQNIPSFTSRVMTSGDALVHRTQGTIPTSTGYGYTPASLAAQNKAEAGRHHPSSTTPVTAAQAALSASVNTAEKGRAASRKAAQQAKVPVTAAQAAASAKANTAEKGRAASRKAAQQRKSGPTPRSRRAQAT